MNWLAQSACIIFLLNIFSVYRVSGCNEMTFNKSTPFPNQTVYSLSDKFLNFPISAIMNLKREGILHYTFKAHEVVIGELDLELDAHNKTINLKTNDLKPTSRENLQLLSCLLQRILNDIHAEYTGITKLNVETVYKSIAIKKTINTLQQDLMMLASYLTL